MGFSNHFTKIAYINQYIIRFLADGFSLMSRIHVNIKRDLNNQMKLLYMTITLLILLQNKMSFASNEFLFVRTAVDGSYEAVIQGFEENRCSQHITNLRKSIMTNGFTIQIVTFPATPLPCYIPVNPPEVYFAVTPLGKLTPGQYTITWTQPTFYTGSVQLNVPASVPIPTLSPVALISLIGLLLYTAKDITRRPS